MNVLRAAARDAWEYGEGHILFWLWLFPGFLLGRVVLGDVAKLTTDDLARIANGTHPRPKRIPNVALMRRDEATGLDEVWCYYPLRSQAREARAAMHDTFYPLYLFYVEGELDTAKVILLDEAPGDWELVEPTTGRVLQRGLSRERAFSLIETAAIPLDALRRATQGASE